MAGSRDSQPWHAATAGSHDMQLRQAEGATASSHGMQLRQAAMACSYGRQREPRQTAMACSYGRQPWHAATAGSHGMQLRLSAMACSSYVRSHIRKLRQQLRQAATEATMAGSYDKDLYYMKAASKVRHGS